MRTNELKRKLASGLAVVGSCGYVPSAKLTEIIGLLGFDFVVIDMEHGPIDTSTAEDMVRAAELNRTTPIIGEPDSRSSQETIRKMKIRWITTSARSGASGCR